MNLSELPDRKKEPYTYETYKRLGLLKATPLERLIMLEIHSVLSTSAWLFRKKLEWDIEDMREFVRELASKIETL